MVYKNTNPWIHFLIPLALKKKYYNQSIRYKPEYKIENMSDFANQLTTITHDDDEMESEPVELPPHLQPSSGIQDTDPAEVAATNTENNGLIEEDPSAPNPHGLFFKGVDDLSTRDVKLYIDSYIKPDERFNNREEYAKFDYKLQWINDTSINAIFVSDEGALEALKILSTVPVEEISNSVERPSQPFSDAVKEQIKKDTEGVQLYVRQSLNGDKKVKGARNYSRYYLLHGEPDSTDYVSNKYRNKRRNNYNNRDGDASGAGNSSNDYYASYLKDKEEFDKKSFESNSKPRSRYRERDEINRGPDLITGKNDAIEDLRGLLGYDNGDQDREDQGARTEEGDDNGDEVTFLRKWRSDKYHPSQDLASRLGSNESGYETPDMTRGLPYHDRKPTGPRGSRFSSNRGRRERFGGRGRERASVQASGRRDEEEDLFPSHQNAFKRDADRERSPTRQDAMEQ